MNCSTLLSNLDFECLPISGDASRILSPFSYSDDGELIGLYMQDLGGRVRITDMAEACFHATNYNAHITPKRLDYIRRFAERDGVSISDGGEISIVSEYNEAPRAFISALNIATLISHMEKGWRKSGREDVFIRKVGSLLEERVPKRLEKNVSITGASGRQISIPFVIRGGKEDKYILPVPHGKGNLSWDPVSRAITKMIDIKLAGVSDKNRYVIFEDLPDKDTPKATTLLATCANVMPYSSHEAWMDRLVA